MILVGDRIKTQKIVFPHQVVPSGNTAIITYHPVLNIYNVNKFTYDNAMAMCDILDDNGTILRPE